MQGHAYKKTHTDKREVAECSALHDFIHRRLHVLRRFRCRGGHKARVVGGGGGAPSYRSGPLVANIRQTGTAHRVHHHHMQQIPWLDILRNVYHRTSGAHYGLPAALYERGTCTEQGDHEFLCCTPFRRIIVLLQSRMPMSTFRYVAQEVS